MGVWNSKFKAFKHFMNQIFHKKIIGMNVFKMFITVADVLLSRLYILWRGMSLFIQDSYYCLKCESVPDIENKIRTDCGEHEQNFKECLTLFFILSSFLQEHSGRVFRLQFDEFQIVSSSHDDTILIWDFLNCSPSDSTTSTGGRCSSPTVDTRWVNQQCFRTIPLQHFLT